MLSRSRTSEKGSEKSKVSHETPRLRPVIEMRKTSFGKMTDDEEDD